MAQEARERPDFLWDEKLTREELREILGSGREEDRIYYAAKILREARFDEVWDYLSPVFVANSWEKLRPKLGRKREFWEFILAAWRRHGLIP